MPVIINGTAGINVASATGVINLLGSTSGAITLQANAIAGTNTITLPASTGTVALTNTVLTSAQLPAGSILQVVNAVKTDTFSVAGAATFADVTGLSVSITPISATSKILIFVNLSLGTASGLASFVYRLVRNSTTICVGDAAGVRPQATGGFYSGDTSGGAAMASVSSMFLDSPATTSATTYKVQGASSTATTVYVNRTVDDRNTTGYDARLTSTITVMEVAA
jgi:hypothetical protein